MERARELGADLVGFACVADLRQAPSFPLRQQISCTSVTDQARSADGVHSGRVIRLDRAKTMVVIGVHLPPDKPEMDWWHGPSDPPGNRVLRKIIDELCSWLGECCHIGTFHLPYHIYKGGTYLKDVAVLAGLGCIGKNNLLITPEYGPRVRLRALTMDIEVPSTGPISFDPCDKCDQRCRKSCPQNAFEPITSPGAGLDNNSRPGRDGNFSRHLCYRQMELDADMTLSQEGWDDFRPVQPTKFCRRCEFSCSASITPT